MSSFYQRFGEPRSGDIAETDVYHSVALLGKLVTEPEQTSPLWVVAITETGEIKIVREDDFRKVGYYGD